MQARFSMHKRVPGIGTNSLLQVIKRGRCARPDAAPAANRVTTRHTKELTARGIARRQLLRVAEFPFAATAQTSVLGFGAAPAIHRRRFPDFAAHHPRRRGQTIVQTARPRGFHPAGEAEPVRALLHRPRPAHQGPGRRAVRFLGRGLCQFPAFIIFGQGVGVQGNQHDPAVHPRADEQGLHVQFFRSCRQIFHQRPQRRAQTAVQAARRAYLPAAHRRRDGGARGFHTARAVQAHARPARHHARRFPHRSGQQKPLRLHRHHGRRRTAFVERILLSRPAAFAGRVENVQFRAEQIRAAVSGFGAL